MSLKQLPMHETKADRENQIMQKNALQNGHR